MPKETIDLYYRELIEGAKFFYSKNAVGKYSPESIGIFGVEESQLHDVFSLGLSTEVIDIFDNAELESARARHVEQYRPRGSFVVAQAPLGIFPYYHNVLYGKAQGECMP
jgi:hypothetical protein